MSQATGSIAQGTLAEQTKTAIALNPQALTVTTAGAEVDRSTLQSLLWLLSLGAVTGTAPTLDAAVQETDTTGTGYGNAAAQASPFGVAFAQKAAAAANTLSELLTDGRPLKRFVRLNFTIAGTTPSFTTSAVCVLSGADAYPA